MAKNKLCCCWVVGDVGGGGGGGGGIATNITRYRSPCLIMGSPTCLNPQEPLPVVFEPTLVVTCWRTSVPSDTSPLQADSQ